MASMNFFSNTVFDESPSSVTATPSDALGSRRDFLSEKYVYCYNAGGNTCAVGYGVKLVTGCSGYSIAATSLSDTVNPCVGVVKNRDIPTANYGWVMVRGFVNVHSTANSTIVGDYVSIGLGAAGAFGNAVQGTSVVGTLNVAGFALGANTGSAGTFYAFINTDF